MSGRGPMAKRGQGLRLENSGTRHPMLPGKHSECHTQASVKFVTPHTETQEPFVIDAEAPHC